MNQDQNQPLEEDAIRRERVDINPNTRLKISMAPGGGFVAVVRAE